MAEHGHADIHAEAAGQQALEVGGADWQAIGVARTLLGAEDHAVALAERAPALQGVDHLLVPAGLQFLLGDEHQLLVVAMAVIRAR